jgi:hypothetical protein
MTPARCSWDFRLTCGSQTLDGIFGKDTGPGGRTPSLYSITCHYANGAGTWERLRKQLGIQQNLPRATPSACRPNSVLPPAPNYLVKTSTAGQWDSAQITD